MVTWLEKVLDRRVGLTKRNNALGGDPGKDSCTVQQLRSVPNGDRNAEFSAQVQQQEKPSQRHSSPISCLKHGTGLQIRGEQEMICKTKGCGGVGHSPHPMFPHLPSSPSVVVSEELLPARPLGDAAGEDVSGCWGSWSVSLWGPRQEGGMPNSKDHNEVAKGEGEHLEQSPVAVRDACSRPEGAKVISEDGSFGTRVWAGGSLTTWSAVSGSRKFSRVTIVFAQCQVSIPKCHGVLCPL